MERKIDGMITDGQPKDPEAERTTPKPIAVLQITLLDDMNVTVSGPLDNFRLTAQMLGQALTAAANFSEQKRNKLIEPASADALRLLRRP